MKKFFEKPIYILASIIAITAMVLLVVKMISLADYQSADEKAFLMKGVKSFRPSSSLRRVGSDLELTFQREFKDGIGRKMYDAIYENEKMTGKAEKIGDIPGNCLLDNGPHMMFSYGDGVFLELHMKAQTLRSSYIKMVFTIENGDADKIIEIIDRMEYVYGFDKSGEGGKL